MKKIILYSFLCWTISAKAQPKEFFTLNADSTKYSLTKSGASYLASLPMKCILQEYPNKINHTAISDSDQMLTPIQQHPAFYGCFDWHSTVHGHWMLVNLLKQFPDLKEQAAIRKVLSTTLTSVNIQQEVKYLASPLTKSFERTYGWAWLLKLQEELLSWNDPDAIKWRTALQPLCDTVIKNWLVFLPKQTYASRSGMHGNTAFGLSFALDYARATHHAQFEKAITQSAIQLFLKDKNAPTIWEPDGADFFSPSLMEAALMRKVLTPAKFTSWFNGWLSDKALQHLSAIPKVSDRTDFQIVHLDGLCFSRSWCMSEIAKQIPATDKRKALLLKASTTLLKASLPNVVSGNYGGEHWLASFAVYAINAN
jgi:hypothetical protein